MDTPIVVSDGSTHLRHYGKKHDFHLDSIAGKVVATLETTNTTLNLLCVHDVKSCTDGATIVQLAPLPGPPAIAWTLNIYNAAGATGTNVLTITSSDNMTVSSTFNSGLPVEVKQDNSGDTASGGANGTEIAQKQLTYDFKSFSFTSYPGGQLTTSSYDCSTTDGKHCKIKITY